MTYMKNLVNPNNKMTLNKFVRPERISGFTFICNAQTETLEDQRYIKTKNLICYITTGKWTENTMLKSTLPSRLKLKIRIPVQMLFKDYDISSNIFLWICMTLFYWLLFNAMFYVLSNKPFFSYVFVWVMQSKVKLIK